MGTTKSKYQFTVESEYEGEPCILGVTYCHVVAANPYCRDSDLDYYGFREVDFEVLRPDGGPWPEADEAWLKDKRLREFFMDEITGRDW